MRSVAGRTILSLVALGRSHGLQFSEENAYNSPSWSNEDHWIQLPLIPQPRRTRADLVQVPSNVFPDGEDPSQRHLRPDTFQRISETLGAINTVGKYIVNMTRGVGASNEKFPEDVPGAIYTISKNVLGRNVTDTIAPLVREALPGVIQNKSPVISKPSVEAESSGSRTCTSPDGSAG